MRDATSAVVMLEEASLSYILTSTHVVPSGSGLNLPASAVLLAHPASLGVQTGCGRVYWTHSNVHEVGEGMRDATSSRMHVKRADSSHLEREPSTAQGQSGLDLPTRAGVPSDPGHEFTHNLREVGGGTHGDSIAK